MKIAIFTDSFYPYLCGVSTDVANRARGLIERGHEVAVFRPSARYSESYEEENQLPEELEIYDLPISISSKRFENLSLEIPLFLPAYKSAKSFNPDIFHVDTEGGVGWQGISCARLMDRPVVTTPHTLWGNQDYTSYLPLLSSRFVWRYLVSFHGKADLVACPSQLMKEKLRQKGLDNEVRVLPNSIEDVELKDEEFVKQKRKDYNLDGDPNLIYVGRISHEKSLAKVIKAYQKVVSSFPDSKFGIIGDGDVREEMEELVKDLNLTDQIEFLGSMPHEKIMQDNLYRLGDIFVTASKTESFGLTVLEAQSFGLPVVAPAAGGISEIVTDGKGAYLYSLETEEEIGKISSLLKKLMENKTKRKKMGEKALENSKNYSVKEIARKTENLYKELIS